jgi:CarD family transcriptional regulator
VTEPVMPESSVVEVSTAPAPDLEAAQVEGPAPETPVADPEPELPTPPPVASIPAAEPQPVAPLPRPGLPHNRIAPVPRPMAKEDEVFAEGDHVVYPTHGVGKVERIAVEEIAGHRLELIHITFEENRMTLRVPVTKARSAGLRKLATRKLFEEALAVLKGRARIKRTMWSRRAQEYEAKINSGDPLSIAEVVRDLHRNAGQPDQSFSERQIYEAAMDRLAAELAALDQTDKATAVTKLTEFLKTV